MSIHCSKWTILPAAVLLLGTAAMAQGSGSSSTSATPVQDPSIGQRKENQLDRIAQGVSSGQRR